MQPTHKQSAATNRHIINAVSVLGPTAKPREILEFLHDKKQAKYVTAKILRGRLCRLKQAGRVSLENGSRNADEMESWRMDIGTIVRGQSRQLACAACSIWQWLPDCVRRLTRRIRVL